VQQSESLLPVLLGAASGTLASRLLLGMANSCFGRAEVVGGSSNTLIAAISTAGTQSITRAWVMGVSPGDRHTEQGAGLHGEGAAEVTSRPCTTGELRSKYLRSSQKFCKEKSLGHTK